MCFALNEARDNTPMNPKTFVSFHVDLLSFNVVNFLTFVLKFCNFSQIIRGNIIKKTSVVDKVCASCVKND